MQLSDGPHDVDAAPMAGNGVGFGDVHEAGSEAAYDLAEVMSETTEEASAETTSSSGEELVQASEECVPVQEVQGALYLNSKSQVLHRTRDDVSFRCGRRLNASYAKVREPNGIRCSRCFNV